VSEPRPTAPTYKLSRQAAADISKINDYIAQDNPDAADRLVARFHETMRQLAEMPGMGTAREELGARLRSFPIGNYLIFYRPRRSGIDVSRVLHGAQHLQRIFAKRRRRRRRR